METGSALAGRGLDEGAGIDVEGVPELGQRLDRRVDARMVDLLVVPQIKLGGGGRLLLRHLEVVRQRGLIRAVLWRSAVSVDDLDDLEQTCMFEAWRRIEDGAFSPLDTTEWPRFSGSTV